MIIGVTGPTGAGKSYACIMASQLFDVKVIDCDEYARKAVCEPMLKELADCFGDGIINQDKTLNRRALAAAAFNTQQGIDNLNRITHPYITALVKQDIEKYENVILDAPTLYESGLDSMCDAVVAVLSDSNLRSDRITKRDNLTASQLSDRQKAVKPDEFYTCKTDKIIINNGNIDALNSAVAEMFGKLLGGNKNG